MSFDHEPSRDIDCGGRETVQDGRPHTGMVVTFETPVAAQSSEALSP
jgi:hypothetical protein